MNAKRNLVARLIGIILLTGLAAADYYVETRHAIRHFRLVSFGLIFLVLTVATAIVPARLRSALLVLTSLAFGLTVIESVAVAKESEPGPPEMIETPGAMVAAPGVGWENGAAGVYHSRRIDPATGHVIFDVDYTIDAMHDRRTRSADTGRPVVFWGASFTFGHGLDDADTLPQRFADLLGGAQKTLNLAVDGYSPAQVLYELQTGFKDKVVGQDPLVFVMPTGAFHSVRTACHESWTRTAPRYETKNGQLVYGGDCLQGWAKTVQEFLDDTASYQMFFKPREIRETHDGIDLYVDIVAEISRLAKAKYGIDVLVPYVGNPVDEPKALHDEQLGKVPTLAYFPGTGYDDASVIAALRARGVKVVDMTLRDDAMHGATIAIPGDNHPTAYADQRRAELVLAQLKAMGIIKPQTVGGPASKHAL